jgi:signal peptidase I
VVVFRHPVSGDDMIKRLVGLPGDRVQVRGGVLFLNDVAVERREDGFFAETYERQGSAGQFPRCENAPVGAGGECRKSRVIETLPNGVSYPVLNIEDNGFADNTPVFTVPEGHFFFMGDNRDNSVDSRFAQTAGGVGFVPFENLIGRADRVMFSSAGTSMLFFWTWRSDRFFHSLRYGD